MKFAIIHKKCTIQDKIKIVYFNNRQIEFLRTGAINKIYEEDFRIFWLKRHDINFNYLDLECRYIVNYGLTLEEYGEYFINFPFKEQFRKLMQLYTKVSNLMS